MNAAIRRRLYVAACAAALLTIMASVHAANGPIEMPRTVPPPNELGHPVCWADPVNPWAVVWPDGTPKEVPCP